jgi:hypothetical protein
MTANDCINIIGKEIFEGFGIDSPIPKNLLLYKYFFHTLIIVEPSIKKVDLFIPDLNWFKGWIYNKA